MRRAVITGLGLVSSIGNNKAEVLESLKEGRSGISYQPDYEEMGLRSHVAGRVDIDFKEHIDRKLLRFMGDAAAYSYIAMKEAIEQSGLTEAEVSNVRTGIVAGSGGASSANLTEAADVLRKKGIRKVGPYRVTRTMGSTVSACLPTPFSINGVNYSMTSACATSAHCIGHAAELIQLGKQDVVFAGGGEEEHWSLSALFDAMGALSSGYNHTPELASRAYDKDRDGFVIAGGGGFVVVEEYEHAKERGANIIAEVAGYAATSDGHDMVQPSGEGGKRAMEMVCAELNDKVDYINAHGTRTPLGDIPEINAIRDVFGEDIPPISSTKSLSGHSLGAAGVQEAGYALLMLENDFICASANIENLDPEVGNAPVVRELIENAGLNTIISNSFGFGGTNAVLAFQRVA
mgnify:CR=1 FL=1